MYLRTQQMTADEYYCFEKTCFIIIFLILVFFSKKEVKILVLTFLNLRVPSALVLRFKRKDPRPK
jgi:hypothetical protein